MANQSYTLYKISMNIFKMCYSKLTPEQRSEVLDTYYDFY